MDIKIYKTTHCPACKMLLDMLHEDAKYTLINIDKLPHLKPEGLTGVPYVEVDGEKLENAFSLPTIIG